jgi:hypothetical protein
LLETSFFDFSVQAVIEKINTANNPRSRFMYLKFFINNLINIIVQMP